MGGEGSPNKKQGGHFFINSKIEIVPLNVFKICSSEENCLVPFARDFETNVGSIISLICTRNRLSHAL